MDRVTNFCTVFYRLQKAVLTEWDEMREPLNHCYSFENDIEQYPHCSPEGLMRCA